MDNSDAVKALEKVLLRGRGILTHQPVARESCEEWTAGAREVIGELFGEDSDEMDRLVRANRRIMTHFQTDPSYYITQLVANLHRELKVVEECFKAKEAGAAAAAARAAVAGLKARGAAASRRAALVWAQDRAAASAAVAFLESLKLQAVVAGQGDVPFWQAAARKDLEYAVVVAGGAGDSALFAAGYLAGRLGGGRVILLLDGKLRIPPVAEFLRTFQAGDTGRWQAQVASDLAR